MLAQPPDQERNLFACKTACDRSSRRPSANATTKTSPLFGTENSVTLQECICYPLTAVYARGTSSEPRLLRVGLNESFCLDSSYARGGVLCATNDGTYRYFNDGRLPQTHGVEAQSDSSRPSRAAAATKTRTAGRLAPHSPTNRTRSDESRAQQR
jgi:hypothetical protein